MKIDNIDIEAAIEKARALIGASVTLGFAVLFSFLGAILWVGGHFLLRYLPWLGLYLLAGRSVPHALPARLANMIGTHGPRGFTTYFLFGIGYGLASLGCRLPVFLVVVGSAIKSQGFLGGVFQFFSYSTAMGGLFLPDIAWLQYLFGSFLHT